MMRLDGRKFGAPRKAVVKALQAEGIPCSGGYGFSLHRQPLFRNKAFGPYLPKSKVDYARTECPNSDMICREQCIWIEHRALLGSRRDMDDIARAFSKIHEHRSALTDWAMRNPEAR